MRANGLRFVIENDALASENEAVIAGCGAADAGTVAMQNPRIPSTIVHAYD
jgi:hypothetical protein